MAYKLLFGVLGVIFFYGFFHGLHLKGMQAKVDRTQGKLDLMQSKISRIREKNSLATSLIDSKDDPATIELILMQNLGLVPQGSRKVYFKH